MTYFVKIFYYYLYIKNSKIKFKIKLILNFKSN